MSVEPVGRDEPKLYRILKFLLAGVPAICIAIPLNWLLVERAGMWKPGAYGLVLVLQLVINFWMCRTLVFRQQGSRPVLVQFWQLGVGNIVFRFAEWCVYVVAVSYAGVPYILAQLGNVAVFAFVKFEYARRVMER